MTDARKRLVSLSYAVKFILSRVRRKTQNDLADKAGLTRVYIGLIERGATSITLEKVYKLAAALDCPVFELLPIVGEE